MRIAFRADASPSIGYGHLSRLVSLATAAVRAGVEPFLVISRPDSDVIAFARRAGLTVGAIDEEPGTSADARATSATATSSILVVDGYAFGAQYLSDLRGSHELTAYVDDFAREPLPCDLVINPNFSGRAEAYDAAAHAEVLAGPDYALVHDRFIAARLSRAIREEPAVATRLLITMGGSDPPGATLAVIEALDGLQTKQQIRVIVGGANPRHDAIRAAAAKLTKHSIDIRYAVEDMAVEMVWSDLVVTASGVTAAELACVGVPGVAFAIADNQEPIAAELARLGLFDVLPSGSAGTPAMVRAVDQLAVAERRRAQMVELQRRTVDGNGKDRIIARLLALQAGERHTRATDGGQRD